MSDSIEDFWRLARKASFHFADDTTKEWHLGSSAEKEACAMLRRNPEWRDEVVEKFSELWRLPDEFKKQE